MVRIEAIDKNGPAINSIIYVNPNALEEARELDKEREDGKMRGLLHGIPVILKDNIDAYDMPTTAGATALGNSFPAQPHNYSIKESRSNHYSKS